MNVLFIGLGSIGLRNLESCQRVRPRHRYAAWRRASSSAPIEGVKFFETLSESLDFCPDLIWICNPTSQHVQTVREVLPSGAALFIEKPLGHEAAEIDAIARDMANASVPFFYGCILRHHPLVCRTSDLLRSGTLGRPSHYTLYSGSYLPSWRPGRDYREIYSAKVSQGGGVTLDLIHEFDFAESWFGPPQIIQGFRGQLSSLEIDSDDTCVASLWHSTGILGQITLTYARVRARRDFEIVFDTGVLRGDLLSGSLQWMTQQGGSEWTETHSIDRDALHDLQTRHVFEILEKGERSPWDIRAVAKLNTQVLGIQRVCHV